jgi:putative transposase
VRAGIVPTPDEYRWSSAPAHCGTAAPAWLNTSMWSERWTAAAWRDYLGESADAHADADAVRAATRTGRPLGSPEFLDAVGHRLGRSVIPGKGGRPRRIIGITGPQRFAAFQNQGNVVTVPGF